MVVRNLLRRQVAVIVENRHLTSVVEVETARGGAAEQKVLAQEFTGHGGAILRALSDSRQAPPTETAAPVERELRLGVEQERVRRYSAAANRWSTPTGCRRLLAVDLDGTLLRPDKRISPADAGALRCAVDAGVAILVATGRGLLTARPVLEALPVPAYAALHNGALMLDPSGAELWRVSMQPRPVAAALPLVRAAGLHPMLYAGVAGAGGDDVTLVLERDARDSPYTQDYLRSKGPILELVEDVAARLRPRSAGDRQLRALDSVAAAATAVARMNGGVECWWSPWTTSGVDLFEAVAPGGDKGCTLRRLTERLA